jgi:hypothetical protein
MPVGMPTPFPLSSRHLMRSVKSSCMVIATGQDNSLVQRISPREGTRALTLLDSRGRNLRCTFIIGVDVVRSWAWEAARSPKCHAHGPKLTRSVRVLWLFNGREGAALATPLPHTLRLLPLLAPTPPELLRFLVAPLLFKCLLHLRPSVRRTPHHVQWRSAAPRAGPL